MPRFTAHRAFFALAGGQLVSTLGSGMTRFGLGLWVLSDEVGGSAADYTTMLFAAILPLGVASLFVGPLIDRWNRRWVMILANAAASAPTIIVAVLYFSDALAIWHLYIALVANGVASAFILPALDASTPMMMPQDQLGRAAGVTQMLQSFEIILAPVLAVPLFLGLGLGAVFVVDFVTFGISIIVLGLSVIPQPARVLQEAGASIWAEFRFGVRYIKERPPFVMLIFFVSMSMLIMPGIGYALATPLSLAISDEAGAAAVLTCFGVGSLVAGVLLAAWGGPKRRMNGILGSMILAGVGGVITGVSESLVVGGGRVHHRRVVRLRDRSQSGHLAGQGGPGGAGPGFRAARVDRGGGAVDRDHCGRTPGRRRLRTVAGRGRRAGGQCRRADRRRRGSRDGIHVHPRRAHAGRLRDPVVHRPANLAAGRCVTQPTIAGRYGGRGRIVSVAFYYFQLLQKTISSYDTTLWNGLTP